MPKLIFHIMFNKSTSKIVTAKTLRVLGNLVKVSQNVPSFDTETQNIMKYHHKIFRVIKKVFLCFSEKTYLPVGGDGVC